MGDARHSKAGMVAFFIAFAMLGSTGSGAAQEPLVTDRPDFTESSLSVGAGVVQFEAGTTYGEFASGVDVFTFGEVLVRWGVFEKLELRFLLPTYATERGIGSSDSGLFDTAVGFKYQLKDGSDSGLIGGMEAAVIASTTMPTGSSGFSSSSWQPAAVLAASWELGRSLGLGMNLGVARPAAEGQRFTSAWLSAALGIGITDEASIFVELLAFDREEVGGPGTLSFQTGLAYLLNPNLQLDLRAARRLTSAGPDVLLGGGIAWRLGT